MFIKYNPKHPHIKVVPVVDGGSVAAESVILNPGTNEVSEEKWNKIMSSLAVEISAGVITPFSVETKKNGGTAKAKTLKDVPVAVASKIVFGCSNKETLRKWFSENLSDEIALLVVKRMRQLKMDIDEMSGEEETLSESDIVNEGDATELDGSADGERTASSSAYDGMTYVELQKAAKDKGIDITSVKKKDALIKALEEANAKGKSDKSGESASGDNIPDFDNPDVKVG